MQLASIDDLYAKICDTLQTDDQTDSPRAIHVTIPNIQYDQGLTKLLELHRILTHANTTFAPSGVWTLASTGTTTFLVAFIPHPSPLSKLMHTT